MTTSLLCLGFGYTAAAATRALQPQRVVGTSRQGPRAEAQGDEPFRPTLVAFDGHAVSAELEAAARAATHVLISIPADAEGCPAARALGATLQRAAGLAWVGYLSATSVYGDRAGGWCFERDRLTPTSARGRARAAAEAAWLGFEVPTHIFRLPGIYGPGRSVFDRIRAGTQKRILKPGAVFNRAHVDDIAGALALSARRPTPGAVFNVADDWPTPPQDPIDEAYRLLDRAPPPGVALDDADVSPMARSFYAEPKRIANAKLKAVLGWRPTYRTYREGLAAILAAEADA